MYESAVSESDGRATVRSVAKAAGVHHSTVARVLKRAPSKGESEAAKRVRRVAAALNYSPDVWAGSLRSGQTKMVGVIVPRLTDVVMAGIFEAIQRRAAECGFLAVASPSDDDQVLQRGRAMALLARRVDGLLLGDAHLESSLLADLDRRGTPFVLFARRSGSHPHIGWDDERGGYLVGRHFLDLGHENVAVIGGPTFASTSTDRIEGFKRAYREAGLEIKAEQVVMSSFYAEGGRDGATRLIREGMPSAIFAVNDYSAIGVMGVLRDEGLTVGRDVSLAGYNDIDIARELTVPLTSVQVPIGELGETAFDMLLQRIEGRGVRSRLLTPVLVERESTVKA